MEEETEKLILKNSDVERLDMTGAFNHLCSCRNMPVELSFPLKNLKPLVDGVLKAFGIQKMELIEKYGDRNSEGRLITPAPNAYRFSKHLKEFQDEHSRFLQLETKIDFEKLTVVLGEDVPDRYLSTNDQDALECLMEFKMKEMKKDG